MVSARSNANLTLTQVLYLPNFYLNLISMSKLTAYLNCSLVFLSYICLIQAMRTPKMIGSTDVVDDLYFLIGTPPKPISDLVKSTLLEPQNPLILLMLCGILILDIFYF